MELEDSPMIYYCYSDWNHVINCLNEQDNSMKNIDIYYEMVPYIYEKHQ